MSEPLPQGGSPRPSEPAASAEPTASPEPMASTEPYAGRPGEAASAPPEGSPGDPWDAWQAEVVEAVRSLPDGGSLTLAAAEGDARPVRVRKARLGGFIPAKHVVVAPWVRLERDEDLLRGVCVGAESFGGSFPFSPEEDAALLTLGWHHQSAAEGRDYLRFWPDDVPQGPFLPLDDARRAAAMVAATFRQVLVGEGAHHLPTVTRG